MKYIVTLNGKQYEVEVDKGQASAALIGNVPASAAASTSTDSAAPVAVSTAAPVAGGDESICSPMPGTILSVKCSAGQAVKKGDILFILEAMKMENEIFAPHDGTVSAVLVTSGTTVDTGTALCIL